MLRAGSYNLLGAQAHGAGPLRDRLFAAVTVTHMAREGFLHNTFLDTHPDDLEQTTARVAVRFTPSTEWKIDFISEIHHSNDGVQRFVPLASEDLFTVAFDFDGRTHIDANVQAIKISHDAGAGWVAVDHQPS